MFFYLCRVLFSGFLQFNGNFFDAQNSSKYREWAPLSHKTLLSLVYWHKRSCSYSDTEMKNKKKEFKFNRLFLTATRLAKFVFKTVANLKTKAVFHWKLIFMISVTFKRPSSDGILNMSRIECKWKNSFCSPSFAFNLAHLECGVWTWLQA